jgi:hypothetical protein
MQRSTVREAAKPAPLPQSVTTITKKVETVPEVPMTAESSAKPTKPTLDEFIRSIPVAEIEDYSFYLYRENELVKIREGYQYLQRLDAKDLNELNLSEFFGSLQEWTRRKFGGSKYELRVNYRKTGEGMYVERFIIEGPPILSSREVVIGTPAASAQPAVSPADEAMKNAIADSVKRQLEGGNRAVDPTEVVRQVMQMMMEANKAALEIATKQAPSAPVTVDPMTQLTTMITALKTLGLIGVEKPAPSIREMVEEMRALGLISTPAPAAAPQNPVTVAIELLKGIKELRELGGESGLAEGIPEPSGIVELARALPVVMDKLPGVLTQIRDLRGPTALPQPTLTGATRPATPTVTPAAKSVAAGAPPEAPAPATPTNLGEIVAGYIRTRVVELFQGNVPGDEVANWLDMSQPNFAGQLGALTPEILINQVIPGDPILRVMAGDPRLPKFVEAFLDYFKPEDTSPVGAKKPV